MTIPSFSVHSVPVNSVDTVVVIGLSGDSDAPQIQSVGSHSHLASVAKLLQASSKLESLTKTIDESGTSVVALLGLGSTQPSEHKLRLAAGAAGRKMSSAKEIEFQIPTATEDEVVAILEGALLGTYRFDRYKSSAGTEKTVTEHIRVITDVEVSNSALERLREKVAAVALIKNLVNTPAAEMTPEILTSEALESIVGLDIASHVLNENDLKREGFGGISGVGQGSINPPRLVKLSYSPLGAQRHVAIVGKGITFDTGGLTLKSGAGMVGMKYDMTGAATALAVIRAAAALKVNVRVTAWLCLAENMPSATATRPNDVLRIRNGKTVEVLNTDAEGRLVLADGLSAASEENPDLIIDIATLTGAARGALGTRTVGAMGNSSDLSRLVESASNSGEAFWAMPLPEELRDLLDSDIADIINGKPGNSTAGMLLGGVFLSEFVGNIKDSSPAQQIPWIHLDIAGTADNPGSAYGFTTSGPTGVTARALIDFLSAGA